MKKLGNFKTGLKFYKNPGLVSICTMILWLFNLKQQKKKGCKYEYEDLWRIVLNCWFCLKTDKIEKTVCEKKQILKQVLTSACKLRSVSHETRLPVYRATSGQILKKCQRICTKLNKPPWNHTEAFLDGWDKADSTSSHLSVGSEHCYAQTVVNTLLLCQKDSLLSEKMGLWLVFCPHLAFLT